MYSHDPEHRVRYADISDAELAGEVEENVPGIQSAMRDPVGVNAIERRREVAHHLRYFVEGQRPAREQQLCQAATMHERHHQK